MHYDIEYLERQVQTLGARLAEYGDHETFAEVLRQIHQPGVTTPAEPFLMSQPFSSAPAQLA